jgi:hypothetical protein
VIEGSKGGFFFGPAGNGAGSAASRVEHAPFFQKSSAFL